ncbi:MAG: hypothetical protein C4294_14455 [Nitrospiraceae bacterium]
MPISNKKFELWGLEFQMLIRHKAWILFRRIKLKSLISIEVAAISAEDQQSLAQFRHKIDG